MTMWSCFRFVSFSLFIGPSLFVEAPNTCIMAREETTCFAGSRHLYTYTAGSVSFTFVCTESSLVLRMFGILW